MPMLIICKYFWSIW